MVVDGDQSELLTASLPILWKLWHLEDNWDLLVWVTWCLAAHKNDKQNQFYLRIRFAFPKHCKSFTLQTFLSWLQNTKR